MRQVYLLDSHGGEPFFLHGSSIYFGANKVRGRFKHACVASVGKHMLGSETSVAPPLHQPMWRGLTWSDLNLDGEALRGRTASIPPTPCETNRDTCVIASVAKSRRAQLQQRSLHLAAASQLGLNSSSAVVTRNGGNAVCTSNRLLAAFLSKAPEGGPDFCALPPDRLQIF